MKVLNTFGINMFVQLNIVIVNYFHLKLLLGPLSAASSFLSLQNLRSKQKKLSIEIDVYFD